LLFITKYYSDEQIGDDEMVVARGINIREEKMQTAIWWENLKVKDHLEDLGLDARSI
jgi:hypothetical protein